MSQKCHQTSDSDVSDSTNATEVPVEQTLSAEERKKILFDWNKTESAYPHVCAHELFERQASQAPDAIALVDGSERWTYRRLNEQANRVARYLRKAGVGPDVL